MAGSPIASSDAPRADNFVAPAIVPLILASSSPRRRDLLHQVGLIPARIVSPNIDETPLPQELPRLYAERMARLKVEAGSRLTETAAFVLAADTVVACGRRILPKTETETAAARCLDLLSGRRHRVYGGIGVIAPNGTARTRLVTTIVTMKRLDRTERAAYLESEEWRGKAGGYAIQGRAAAFVKQINGSYSNVVGLSLYDAMNLLRGLGYRA